MPIAEASAPSFRWINLTGATADDTPEIQYLREHFPYFSALDIKDCVSTGQRPKLEVYDRYAFLVLMFPIYNRQTREIESSEIDFFIGKDFLITIHDNKRHVLEETFKEFHAQAKSTNPSPDVLLTVIGLINRLLGACFPMLDHISLDLHAIERLIFRDKQKEMVEEILVTRRNIVDFRKIMQAQKNTIKKLTLAQRVLNLPNAEHVNNVLSNTVERSKEIWDNLEAFKEAVEALQETNESLISYRLNDVMKTYTTISVVIFTLTLITTIFAARLPHTPLVGTAYGFYSLLGILVGVSVMAVGLFKWKRWL
ncbi:MAG: magnesium transporter CorA family protein [Patescibacteria group bacterium]